MADTTRMMTDVAISVVPANEASWDDLKTVFGTLHVGSRSIVAAAGFAEVSRPTRRQVVMRIDF